MVVVQQELVLRKKINTFDVFSEEQARMLAKTVSVDHTNCSLSFNEFLTLMSTQQEAEPNHETLVDVFA